MSFNVINFPPYLRSVTFCPVLSYTPNICDRYRTGNILLDGIMPGPKEQTGDQLQRFMRVPVNELIRLYMFGFTVRTTRYPMGRVVRVILVCVICDKPAAHKLGGFGSHSHTFFCHRCWIQKSEGTTAAAFQTDGNGFSLSVWPILILI